MANETEETKKSAAAPEEAAEAQSAAEEAATETPASESETEKDGGKMKKKDWKEALEKKDAELADQKDQYLRLMAEYQNYRNRTTEEKKKIRRCQGGLCTGAACRDGQLRTCAGSAVYR